MSATVPETASQIITLLAGLMLVLQILLAVQPMLMTNIRLFALQSLLLASIAGIVGYKYTAPHVLVVAALTLAGKVIFLPWRLERASGSQPPGTTACGAWRDSRSLVACGMCNG